MPEPVHEGTPPDVYVLGMYCRIKLRGVGNVMKTAPKKKAIYWAKLRKAYFNTGRLGDYEAGMGEFMG